MRALTFIAVLLAAIIVPAPPAMAQATDFTVVNSASYLAGSVPPGALLSIFTNGQVTIDTVGRAFSPWTYYAPGNLYVEATCAEADEITPLPILYASPFQLNVYYPNQFGTEPFGTCANAGTSRITVHPATGMGPAMSKDLVTVLTHPGVFAAPDNAPSGQYVNGPATTALSTCLSQPASCPAANATLVVNLTGSEMCTYSCLSFDLAPVVNGVTGTYVQQTVSSIAWPSTGVERVWITVNAGTPAGEYRLRVRNNQNMESPPPLTVRLG